MLILCVFPQKLMAGIVFDYESNSQGAVVDYNDDEESEIKEDEVGEEEEDEGGL